MYNDNARPLTSDDIKAARTADTACFDYFNNGTETSQIRLSKKNDDIFNTENEWLIPVDARFESYSKQYPLGYNDKPSRCFSHNPLYKFANTLCPVESLFAILRKGDEIELHWIFGNHSGYTEDMNTNNPEWKGAQLYTSELRAIVKRGKKRLSFVIGYSICPVNTASMIQI